MRMAKSGHHDRRERLAGDPFLPRNQFQDAQLGANPIVGPSLEFQDSLEVFGRRDWVEDADGWIAARNETKCPGLVETCSRRLQFQAPRRESSRRLTR
jgi:hypothetical protein